MKCQRPYELAVVNICTEALFEDYKRIILSWLAVASHFPRRKCQALNDLTPEQETGLKTA